MSNLPDCVVLTLTATGIAVVRDVAATGRRIIGVDSDANAPGRACAGLTAMPAFDRMEFGPALADALVAHGRDQGPAAGRDPASDAAVEFLIAHRDALLQSCRVSSAMTDECAGSLLDKHRFGDRCREDGIDVPLTVLPNNHADIDAFVQQAGLPCIVKPRAGHLWRKKLHGAKLLVPESRRELDRVIDEVVGDPTAVVLQELVPGPESEIVVGFCLFSEDGEPLHVLTGRKVRQFPLDFGSGALVVTEPLDDVRKLSIEVLSKLGYRGVCGTEFKRDPRNGRLRLVEINARPVLWYDLCRAAGTHLLDHYQELAGLPVTAPVAQRERTVWRYLTRDVIAVVQRHRKPLKVFSELRKTPKADTFATMTTSDPRTIAATARHTALQAISHLSPGK